MRLIRDGEKVGGGVRGYGSEGRGRLNTYRYTVTALKMGSDESHSNVSVGNNRQSHRTVSTNHILFEEKGEPKRYRTAYPNLTPYPLGQTGSRKAMRLGVCQYQMSGWQCSCGKVTTVIAEYHMTESASDAG